MENKFKIYGYQNKKKKKLKIDKLQKNIVMI